MTKYQIALLSVTNLTITNTFLICTVRNCDAEYSISRDGLFKSLMHNTVLLNQGFECAAAHSTVPSLNTKGRESHWFRLRWQDATSYILWHFSMLEIML